jgi:hypothetical protein
VLDTLVRIVVPPRIVVVVPLVVVTVDFVVGAVLLFAVVTFALTLGVVLVKHLLIISLQSSKSLSIAKIWSFASFIF